MMNVAKRIFIITFLAGITCLSATAQQRFTDFESGVPSYFSTTSSTSLTTSLTTSSDHVKDGIKALKWSATNGNKITATDLNIPASELGSYDPNSAQLFIYSPSVSVDKLIIEFLDNNGVVQRTGTMLLNFKGWRDYHRSYRYDYSLNNNLPGFVLNQCRITYNQAPGGSGIKNLFFDNFTFIGNKDARLPGPHMALDYELFRQEVGEDPLGAYLQKKNITVGTASITELSSLQIVKTNYARTIGGVTPAAVTAAKTYVDNCNISRNTDGSIKGRGLLASNDRATLALIATHVQSLTRAFVKNGDTDAKAKLLLFTECIIDQGVSEGGRNDFPQSTYTEIRIFNIGFLEALTIYPEQLRIDVIKLLKWSNEYNKIYDPNFIPGQNTDFLHVKLAFLFETALSLTSVDETVNDLKYAKTFLENYSLTSEGATSFHTNHTQVQMFLADIPATDKWKFFSRKPPMIMVIVLAIAVGIGITYREQLRYMYLSIS